MDRNALAELLQALESRRDAEERRREERYTALIERPAPPETSQDYATVPLCLDGNFGGLGGLALPSPRVVAAGTRVASDRARVTAAMSRAKWGGAIAVSRAKEGGATAVSTAKGGRLPFVET
ncbi:UNVERIFIED_CONTAM: hypothetical protein FKN15_055931 [Acipenser sinensis]